LHRIAAEVKPMVHVCNPKVNNSEDGTELIKCTNWWKTERVFSVFIWVTAPYGACICSGVSGEPTASIFRDIETGSGGEYSSNVTFN
jgi:hypothetical protein